jgi:outer membrane murein-binding lipoprotein Lpp
VAPVADYLPGTLIGASGLWVLYLAVRTSLTLDRPLAHQLRAERARNDELRALVDQLREEVAKAGTTAARARSEADGLEIQLRYVREEAAQLTAQVHELRRNVRDR